MTTAERKLAAPEVTVETKPYWDAATEGKLLVKKCNDCGKSHHYPRAACPFCYSLKTEWQTASGKGTVYSFSVLHGAPVPYALAYVTLAEGPTMMTNIVDCDFKALKVGTPVKVVFKPTVDGPALPMFTPA